MKMPNTNSKLYKIIKLLLTGAQITPEEGVLQHGTLRLTLAEISELYRDLVVRGCADTVCEAGPRIRASDALLERFGLIEVPPDPSQQPKVPPREMPPFKPLSRQNIPSSRGRRDGSNDLRDLPSHYGNCTLAKEQA
jgi:hypothetical protein